MNNYDKNLLILLNAIITEININSQKSDKGTRFKELSQLLISFATCCGEDNDYPKDNDFDLGPGISNH